MESTKISWTDATWNVARGCTKVDADCLFCYMYRDGERYKYDAKSVVKTKSVFGFPLRYKETRSGVWHGRPLVFTSSLTDFFHPEIDAYRDEAWNIIRRCPHLVFQILTKRPERIKDCLPPDWGTGWDNVWLGTSMGSQGSQQRMIDLAMTVDAKVKFLSLEPLHGSIDLSAVLGYSETIQELVHSLLVYDWVIVGGESGNETGRYRYRECKLEWIERIVADCKTNSIPVFVKQLGTQLAKELGASDRHGTNINDFPESIRFQEFPRLY